MPYDNTVRVSATFNEVGLITPVASSQPEVLVLGPASSGRSYEKYFVGAIGQAGKEFGNTSPLLRGTHEAFAEGADNISAMRVGGRPGSVTITLANSETLTLTPWDRGDDILTRYVPIMDGANLRLMIYDIVDDVWVYDSEEIYVIDEGTIQIDSSDNWTNGYDLNETVDLTAIKAAAAAGDAVTLADLNALGTDFTPIGTASAVSSVDVVAGTDGLSASLVEKYAALATAYHLLNFRDADIILPVDVYADDANIARISSPSAYGYFWRGRTDAVTANGLPEAGSTADVLGYVWHNIYEGELYTFFTDSDDTFSVTSVAASSGPHFADLELTVSDDFKGKGGNANTFQYVVGAAGPTATATPNSNGGVDIVLTDDGSATNAACVPVISAALSLVVLPDGTTYDDVIEVTGVSVAAIGASAIARANFTGGAGGHVLTHETLTGETVPSAAMSMIASDATDTWLRETSFDHQLATFCHLGSTVWKAMIGVIGFNRPDSVSRRELAKWIGTLPDYSTDGRTQWVSTGDNGSGLLGSYLYAGKSGYRAHIPNTGTSTDGAAGGGLILTNGTGLPTVGGNLGSGFPYGISDGDEATDDNGFPVDIGKFLMATFDWPVLVNGYGNRTQYRGSLAGPLAGLIARTPANRLVIGQFGKTRSTRSVLNIHPTQLDGLAKIRLTGTKADEDFGTTLISSQTAAHPNSDYAMLSTTRSVAAVVNGIRRIAKPFLGRPFNPATIASLQQDVDGYLSSIRGGENGLHDGAVAQLTFTRRDKILGHLEIRLRMVPPFGIRDINVATSLAADESEL